MKSKATDTVKCYSWDWCSVFMVHHKHRVHATMGVTASTSTHCMHHMFVLHLRNKVPVSAITAHSTSKYWWHRNTILSATSWFCTKACPHNDEQLLNSISPIYIATYNCHYRLHQMAHRLLLIIRVCRTLVPKHMLEQLTHAGHRL